MVFDVWNFKYLCSIILKSALICVTMNIPQHIAIIMDGNGRWAKSRGLSRIAGHSEGAKRIKEIVKAAKKQG